MRQPMQPLPTVAICLALFAMMPMTIALAQSEGGDHRLALEDCRIADPSGLRTVRARCGTLSRPENPDQPQGRQIELFVAVVPTLNNNPAPDALTVIAGGPGAASTEFYASFAAAFARARSQRDILLVDQRGTGRSHPLECDFEDVDPSAELDPVLMREIARDCASALQGDLRYYTTSVAVHDLEAVREALGYDALNLYGASYGTRVALHYLRRYPEHTRTVIIDGVVPADIPIGPEIALDAQDALNAIFARCAEQAGCNGHFPDLARSFDNLRAKLASAPQRVILDDPVTGEPTEQRIGDLELGMALRLLSYAPTTTALIPLLLHQAAVVENLKPLAAQAMMTTAQLGEMLSYGMHNSIVCAEDVPFFDGFADHDALALTYLGELQVEALKAICDVWPRGVIDEDFKTPVRSDKPVLVLSGSADPVTPPRNGARAIGPEQEPYLSNALHIVAEAQGHGIAGTGCMPRILGEFIEAGSLQQLDVSCVERVGPMPFFDSFVGPAP